MSNSRERLLRLIDGGLEAFEEVQDERPPSAPPPVMKKETIFDRVKTFWGQSQIALILILLILALRSASDFVKSFEGQEKTPLGTGLRLVGVDWGDPPVALLEDLKSGKTYFARKGDKIKETRLKQIFKDKVLIVFRGKMLELR